MCYRLLFACLLVFLSSDSKGQVLPVIEDSVKVKFMLTADSTLGTVGGFKGRILLHPNKLEPDSIYGSVDVMTLNTKVEKRDDHLKSSDFFDAEKYPAMSFWSKEIRRENEEYVMTGMMKIKDVEKEEKIVFNYEDGAFKGRTTINSADYGVTGKPEKGEVEITFILPLGALANKEKDAVEEAEQSSVKEEDPKD